MFYVYFLINSLDNTVIYIGKGKGNRINYHEKNLKTHYNTKLSRKINSIIKKGGKIIHEKVFETCNENDALLKEISLINEHGVKNLCNLTNGGEGGDTYTNNPNLESIKKKISNSIKNSEKFHETMKSKEYREYLSNAVKNSEKRKETMTSEEYKINMSNAIKNSEKCKNWYEKVKNEKLICGEKNPNFGNKWSSEQKKSLSEKKLEYYKTHTPYNTGRKFSFETCHKISESRKGKKMPDSIREKIKRTVLEKKPWLYQDIFCNKYIIKNIQSNEIIELFGRKGVKEFFYKLQGHTKKMYKLFGMQQYNNYMILDIIPHCKLA